MTKRFFSILITSTVLLFLASCSVTKKLDDNEIYLQKIDYKFKGKKKFKQELPDYLTMKPNVRALGFLPFKDWAYNQVSVGLDSVFADYYATDRKFRKQKLLDSLYIKYGYPQFVGDTKWIARQYYKAGAKPVVLDTAKAYFDAHKLKDFYFDRGYFNALVQPEFKIDSSKQKGEVIYDINAGKPSDITSYEQNFQNKEMESLYQKNKKRSSIKVGERFDVDNLLKERSRLEKLYQNNGYFRFNEYENELIFRVDTTESKTLKTTLKIAKSPSDSLDSTFNKYYFKEIKIRADKGSEENYDTLYEGYHIVSKKPLKLKPRVYTDAIVIEPGQLYSREKVNKTRELIFDRENFVLNGMSIQPQEDSDSLLVAEFDFLEKKKYDIELSLEGFYSQYFQFGISPGVKLLTRNVFGGGENWENTLRGTFGTINNGRSTKGLFNAYDITFGSRLNFPRFLFPFGKKGLVPKSYNPKTSAGIGISSQQNIGLGSQSYTANLIYSMKPTIYNHSLELVNFQYLNNRESDSYYNIFTLDGDIRNRTFDAYFMYDPNAEIELEDGELTEEQLENDIYFDSSFSDSLPNSGDYTFEDFSDYRNMIFRKRSVTQDVFIQSFIYNFIMDEKKKNKKNPLYISSYTELGGLLPALYDLTFGLKKETLLGTEVSTIGGVPYSEFIKFDFDVRKTFNITKKSSVVLRNFIGIAYPFGNSNFLPFSRSYFAGGSNDVRAWRAYQLSPNPLRPDDNGTYIDNFKITWNAEYRFNLVNSFNGALFIDAGNIWSLSYNQRNTEFKFNRFLSQLGIGSGFGLRYDLTYILLRLDLAYKMHDPAYPEGDRWFPNVNILKPQVHFGINYPF